ncbi:MAG: hypothetical protein RI897_777 [Verrucomicrobiota bacterium]
MEGLSADGACGAFEFMGDALNGFGIGVRGFEEEGFDLLWGIVEEGLDDVSGELGVIEHTVHELGFGEDAGGVFGGRFWG